MGGPTTPVSDAATSADKFPALHLKIIRSEIMDGCEEVKGRKAAPPQNPCKSSLVGTARLRFRVGFFFSDLARSI